MVAALSTLADDWNTGVGGNSARDSLSTEVGPTSPEILWQGSRPAIVAQQAAIEGDLVVMARIESFDIPTGTWIVAHDLFTGEERWAVQLPFDFESDWRSRVSAIRDGRVYATRAGNTNESFLYALDVKDGSILWQSEDLVDEATTESLAFTAEGDLIVGNFESLIRIDATDGSTMWQVARSCPTSNGCLSAVFGDRVYVWEASANGPIVTAFHVDDGSRLYSTPGIGGGFVQQLGLLVGPDGAIYAPRTQNNEITDFFVAFEDTGSEFIEKWSRPLGYVPFASFGIGLDGSVYMYETPSKSELRILRLDPADGSVIDESNLLPINFPAQPRIAIDATGTIFFTNGGFSQGRLFSFDPDLTERWSSAVQNVNVGGPAIGQDGMLIVCGVGNDVRAYFTGSISTPAELTDLSIVDGSLIDGGLDELVESDDESVQTRSEPGFFASEPNVMEIIIGAHTQVTAPTMLDLTIESRINHPQGTATIGLHNWTSDTFDDIGTHDLGFDETIATFDGIDATDYVRDSDSRIELSLRHVVAVIFTAAGFDSFIDQTRVGVE